MKKLIVTADDFGLAASINRGIVKARETGIVTSVSIMPSGEAVDEALALARKSGDKWVGAHLALSEGAPVSKPSEIPTLVSKDGAFPENYYDFVINLLLGRVDLNQVYAEFSLQLKKIVDAGFKVVCLSGHSHIQMLPAILNIFLKLAAEFRIPAIRYPRRDKLTRPLKAKKVYRALLMTLFEYLDYPAIRQSGLLCTERVAGFLDAGGMDEKMLSSIIDGIDEGCTELVVHPGMLSADVKKCSGFHSGCETELAALTSQVIKKKIRDSSIKLISYEDFISGR